MLAKQAEEYYKKGFSCAEGILHAVNEEYNLELDDDILKLVTGFQGGMGSGETCGCVTASVLVINYFYGRSGLDQNTDAPQITKNFIKGFKNKLETVLCEELIKEHFNPETKCSYVVKIAAKLLEGIIEEAKGQVA